MGDDKLTMIPVPFHDDTLWAADRAGNIIVAIKPISDALGLDWRSQRKRLERSPTLAKGRVIMSTPSPGGTQETVCLALKLVPGWLFGIETRMVKPSIRAKIERYQEECYEVLYQHFRGNAPEPAVGRRPSTPEIQAGIEAHLHPHQLRVLAAIKAHGAHDTGAMVEATGLSAQSVQRACYLLWYLGVVETFKDGPYARIRVVPAEKRR